MLTFSQEQLDALHDAMDDRFQARVVATIARSWPQAGDAEKDPAVRDHLSELVYAARERAAKLNIVEAADVAVFAGFLVAGSHLNEAENVQFRAWVTPFLVREGSAGDARIALAERSLRRKASDEALAARLCKMVDSIRAAFAAGPA